MRCNVSLQVKPNNNESRNANAFNIEMYSFVNSQIELNFTWKFFGTRFILFRLLPSCTSIDNKNKEYATCYDSSVIELEC